MESLYHLIRTEQLASIVKELLEQAARYEKYLSRGTKILKDLRGVRVELLFFEASSRTFSAFFNAASTLGATVFPILEAGEFSSFAKEESLEDGIEFWSGVGIPYLRCADIIVIRHPEPNAAEKAAKVSAVPIINAGCGGQKGDHPTQVLLDLYTFQKFLGRLENFTIGYFGDLRFSRIVEPEVRLLSQYPDIKFHFVAPEGFDISPETRDFLTKKGVPFKESGDIREVIEDCDLGYFTRVQKNRLEKIKDQEKKEELWQQYAKNRDNYALTLEVYQQSEKKKTIFCHPGPISSKEKEIRPEVKKLSRVKYLEQWAYGLPTKMALLVKAWQAQKIKDYFEKNIA